MGMPTLILDRMRKNQVHLNLTHSDIDKAVAKYLKDGGKITKQNDITELLPENIDDMTNTDKWRDFHGS
jgi:hypothetical protein